MSTEDALQWYQTILGHVFSKERYCVPKKSFRTSTFEAEIKRMIAESARGEFMLDNNADNQMGKA
jgi:hypothetical protein